MVSCLEYRSKIEREDEVSQNTFSKHGEVYSEGSLYTMSSTHAGYGKGTNHPGHTDWLPHCVGNIGQINYINFDTLPESGPGHAADNEMRNISISKSLYSHYNTYEEYLARTNTLLEGQYYVP